ncbi:MAG TPA: hypothetical protein VHO43_00935 [Ignavibacteriales bacterium]|nr:hypothetical protein [Ignavibacteriales bacterium]
MKKFTIVLFIFISQIAFAQGARDAQSAGSSESSTSHESSGGSLSAGDVKFVFQIPMAMQLALNKTPGGYLNLAGGVGVDYVPQNFAIHAEYIPFSTELKSFDINAGYILSDDADIEGRGVYAGQEDLGDKIRVHFRSQAMEVRHFQKIRLGFHRLFGEIGGAGNSKINVVYLGYESDELLASNIYALNNVYVDLMYGNYEGNRSYDKKDMSKFGGRIGFSNDWGWFCSSSEEIGYQPISGFTLNFAIQIFFVF